MEEFNKMFMYLQKNKKGFTLIELMVVVAIIGILALLGLRLYTGQQEKAKESIVKANASTVHTLIQSELADGALSDDVIGDIGGNDDPATSLANMENPFGTNIAGTGTKEAGVVIVTASGDDNDWYTINAYGADGSTELFTNPLEAMR
jgi:prepilin-type N-terminal cleavage/methylation domain-containing protein